MKKCTKGVLATVAVAVLALSVTLLACGLHNKTTEEKADYMVDKITSKMDLDTNQAMQLKNLKDELMVVHIDIHDRRDATHKVIDELFSQPTLDQQKALQLIQEYTAAVNERAPAVISFAAGFYDSLTPEQQTMLREEIVEHRKHKHHWHH